MPEVMEPQGAPLGARGAGQLRAENREGVLDRPVRKGSAPLGDKERNG
jgi:hypothetical protein